MRPAATVVIPAWNQWEMTRSCLETLRPTLGLRDQVVVVDNGSEDGTAEGLRRYPWVTVVTHESNTGFAAGCNSGAAVATGEVVVFLNNDTLLPSRWLDGLLRPFTDPTVGATGPRSNFVSGPQLVPDVPYTTGRTADLQRFARAWREEHRGQTSPTHRLVGFCLAVRRTALEDLGGFDEGFGLGGAEDDDLCLRLVDAGWSLLIAHESFVHHHGHATFEGNGVDWFGLQEQNLARLADKRSRRSRRSTGPLLSACMIVKDEEDNLPSCLEALRGFADEVVVYDTGSTDATVEIARQHGATVIEGYWDDDFARARNASLEHCSGTWVLQVDADEVVQGDLRQVRDELRRADGFDAFIVQIANVDDRGDVGAWHTSHRLFRRGRASWVGALHEQVEATDGGVLHVAGSSLRLRHSGYTTTAIRERGKGERNLRVAEQAATSDDVMAVISLSRALQTVGRAQEAFDRIEEALLLETTPRQRQLALRVATELLLELGRPREALTRVAALRTVSSSPAICDYLEGMAHLNLQDHGAAVTCFDRIEPGDTVEDTQIALPGHLVPVRKAMALVGDERWQEAAAELLLAVAQQGASHALWVSLLEAHVRGGLPLGPLLELDPHPRNLTLLGHAANADPATAGALAAHLWEHGEDRLPVVAFLSHVVGGMDLEALVDWAVRLRSAGFEEHCPLVSCASDAGRTVLDRLRATALVATACADRRAPDLLLGLLPSLGDAQITAALLALDDLAPSYLPTFVTALASDPVRRAATSRALSELGAQEQAEALLQHSSA